LLHLGVEDSDALDEDGNQFMLPDIKNALRKREIEEEIARMAEEERELKPKIKRSDTKAFRKVRRFDALLSMCLKCILISNHLCL
jgi:hypothetical protein